MSALRHPARPPIGRDTRLCMSLSARPSNFGSRFHNSLYDQLGLDYVYKSFSTKDLPGAIGGIRALGIRGCAISMPFKEAVIPLLDGLEGSARAIDSVNTIVNDDGRLTGYNTDYSAVRALLAQAGIGRDTRFILRGSGGMAKAVAAALRDEGVERGLIVARNADAGPALAATYGYDWAADLPDIADTPPLLINVTPIGMAGGDEDALPFPEAMVAAADIAFDVVAFPVETRFLALAQGLGKRRITGAEVAVLQALEQFVLYTGVTPDAGQVRIAAEAARTA
ncbi:MAG: shikimate 5-dehydrogenase [Sphingomonas sp.]|nr:shikimate 5-dehydrogenase [Sphingomonas sp.]MDX3883829.1 shikimate 5-dehydrogenase [Sphingomonas sp.]